MNENEMINGVQAIIDISPLKARNASDGRSIMVLSKDVNEHQSIDLTTEIHTSNGRTHLLRYWNTISPDADEPKITKSPIRFFPEREGVYFLNNKGEIVEKVELHDGTENEIDRNL